MRVFITGANGFVGTNLSRVLTQAGHEVTALVRRETTSGRLHAGVTPVLGESTRPGDWQKAVPGHDLLINLAGTSIFNRWTAARKQAIRDSRILTTRNLVDAIPAGAASRITLLSTSAVGYYGCTGDEELDENSPPGDDFLATLAKEWEAEALKATGKGVRVVITRFGVVLGHDGGALAQMVLPFRFFVGGPLGSGRQWFSWIHVEDLCRAIHLCATADSQLSDDTFNVAANTDWDILNVLRNDAIPSGLTLGGGAGTRMDVSLTWFPAPDPFTCSFRQ